MNSKAESAQLIKKSRAAIARAKQIAHDSHKQVRELHEPGGLYCDDSLLPHDYQGGPNRFSPTKKAS